MIVSEFIYNAKRTILNVIGIIYDFFITKNVQNQIAKPTILVIKMDAIGDFFVWLSVAYKYRNLYPATTHNLVLITNPACIDLANSLHYFDNVIGIKRKRYILNYYYRLQCFKEVNTIKYEKIIYHANSREFASGDLLVRNLVSDTKISIKSDYAIDSDFWLKKSDKFYTKIYNLDTYIHELEKNNAFLELLGHTKTKLELASIITKKSPLLQNNYVVISIGARIGIRKWPLCNFIDVIAFILSNTNLNIVLSGTKEDIIDGQQIVSKFNTVRIINNIHATSLLELCDWIGNAEFLIGNETSSVHIAASVGTKSICVLGGGHFNRFVPYPAQLQSEFKPMAVFENMLCFGCDWRCQFQSNNTKAVPCIENISSEKVTIIIKSLLNH